MKFARLCLALLVLLMVSGLLGVPGYSQQGPVRGRIDTPLDPEKETISKHNLDVARWYLIRRKAYAGAVDRLKEIIETYPEFSRMDEVVYLMGEAHLKLGKTEIATDYYNKLVKDYVNSEFLEKARVRLSELKGPKN